MNRFISEEDRIQRLADLVRQQLHTAPTSLQTTALLSTSPLASTLHSWCTMAGFAPAITEWNTETDWRELLATVSQHLTVQPVILTLTQAQLAKDWTKIANWKENAYRKPDVIGSTGNETPAYPLFIVITLDQPTEFEFADAKNISDTVFNVNVEY